MAIAHTKRVPAQIPVIDYELIHARDSVELGRLFKACQSPPAGRGSFHLNLRGPSTQQLLKDLVAINRGMVSYSKQPKNVKMADFRKGIERGFKSPEPFRNTFEISWDDEKSKTHKLPPALKQCSSELSATTSRCDAIARDLLSAISSSLGLITIIAPEKESHTGLKLVVIGDSVPSWELTANAHTDFGLLTLMFCDAPIIELVDPTDLETWHLVQPVEGCAMVHVGNTLQQHSYGILQSPLHRVVQPEGVSRDGTCITSYYLRPEYE